MSAALVGPQSNFTMSLYGSKVRFPHGTGQLLGAADVSDEPACGDGGRDARRGDGRAARCRRSILSTTTFPRSRRLVVGGSAGGPTPRPARHRFGFSSSRCTTGRGHRSSRVRTAGPACGRCRLGSSGEPSRTSTDRTFRNGFQTACRCLARSPSSTSTSSPAPSGWKRCRCVSGRGTSNGSPVRRTFWADSRAASA